MSSDIRSRNERDGALRTPLKKRTGSLVYRRCIVRRVGLRDCVDRESKKSTLVPPDGRGLGVLCFSKSFTPHVALRAVNAAVRRPTACRVADRGRARLPVALNQLPRRLVEVVLPVDRERMTKAVAFPCEVL